MSFFPQKDWPTQAQIHSMDSDKRAQFQADYYNNVYAKAGYKPTFVQKMKFRLGALFGIVVAGIGIILIYGVINLFVVGGQELWHVGDNKKLDEMKIHLDNQLKVIQDYETLNKNGRITDKQFATYKETLDLYNKQVDEYNSLAKSAGTTWYIIPGIGKGH